MKFYEILWRLLVVAHFVLIVANFLAIFILPFVEDWYVAAPLITLVVNLTFSPIPCPLTSWENKLRVRLGRPRIKYFIGHYMLGKRYDNEVDQNITKR